MAQFIGTVPQDPQPLYVLLFSTPAVNDCCKRYKIGNRKDKNLYH